MVKRVDFLTVRNLAGNGQGHFERLQAWPLPFFGCPASISNPDPDAILRLLDEFFEVSSKGKVATAKALKEACVSSQRRS